MNNASEGHESPRREQDAAPLKDPALRRAERWIVPGAPATAIGIMLCFTSAKNFGGLVTVCGLVACLIGLHRYGRSGSKIRSIVATKNSNADVAP